MKYRSITGMRDVLPEEQPYWRYIEQKIYEITRLYGYKRIDPPVLEETALFVRGVGETTDIVEKEMYSFQDKGEGLVTMRPEFTAGVLRAYLQNGLHVQAKPVKLFSIGPVFRYERPQAGRFRQHNQFNVEALGEQDPALDLEIMSIAWQLYAELGFKGLKFQLNSTGCPVCRPSYIAKLKDYYQNHYETICNDCKRRLDKNPLRLLDCKNEGCRPVIAGAPVISEHLCNDCNTHFAKLRHYLQLTNRDFAINHKLVRGLDYYTKTVFEVWAQGIGAQNAMCGGGRYDGLIEQLGGEPTPGIGFGSGIERIILSMQQQNLPVPTPQNPAIFIASMGDKARLAAIELTFKLRNEKLATLLAFGDRSIKSQMKEANRYNARYAVILGEREIDEQKASIKNLETGSQTDLPLEQLVAFFQENLKNNSL
ncbi:MAG TPA: histidine--tRNA ligase [bacterium]|nr:histidine--tRNA ligase [bacterium]HPN45078.1 histidine--tRNA ligase [bacterium]